MMMVWAAAGVGKGATPATIVAARTDANNDLRMSLSLQVVAL